MAVPKAAVDENHGMEFRENEIWLAWQELAVKPISQAECVEGAAQDDFRFGVPPADASHHSRPSCHVDDVDHRKFSWLVTAALVCVIPRNVDRWLITLK
jgi:hypothetical protein